MKILENVPLSSLTTMRLGGPVRFLIEIETKDDIPAAYEFAKDHHLPTFILGGGANTIGHDSGYPGVIIKNAMTGIEHGRVTAADNKFSGGWRLEEPENTARHGRVATADNKFSGGWRLEGDPQNVRDSEILGEEKATGPAGKKYYVTALGGTEWDDVVAYTTERGLTGIEALSKIPGLAGAAPVQNIGAYGQDISETLTSAEVYDTATSTFRTLKNADFHFAYRRSLLNSAERGRYFVISITLALTRGTMPRPFYKSIEQYIDNHGSTDFTPQGIREIVSAIRASKLPDPTEKASSGSFFKNIYLSDQEAKAAEAKGYPVYHGHDGLKINSGWLIEAAGLKGQLLHGMRISSSAALVLINESATSYADLAAARQEIIDKVYAKFGFRLEQEPVEII